MHDWQFVGVPGSSHPGLIAACKVCGEIRSTVVVIGGNRDKIDLAGKCPGAQGIDRTARSG